MNRYEAYQLANIPPKGKYQIVCREGDQVIVEYPYGWPDRNLGEARYWGIDTTRDAYRSLTDPERLINPYIGIGDCYE